MKRFIIITLISIIAVISLGFLFINNPVEPLVLERKEFLKWVEDPENDLRKIQDAEGILFEVTYCPVDYLIAKEFRSNEVKKNPYDLRKSEMNGLQYFKLRLKRKNSNEEILTYNLVGGQQGYYQRVDYLSYGLDENLFLVQNNLTDTLRATMYHFERTYGVAPYIDFLIAFPNDTTVKDPHKVFIVDDVVFGKGVQRFDFNSDKLKKSPKLLVN